jgi:K319L-like, PKD domain
MKAIICGIASFLIIWFFSIAACKKEKDVSATNNRPPIANAGADQRLQFLTCNSFGSAELDGSASSDADNNIAKYSWNLISGSIGTVILNPNSSKTRVEKITAGTTVFKLTVVDEEGLSSVDTVLVIATGLVEEQDLDITFNGTFSFLENQVDWDCWYYYYGNCKYFDFTTIQGSGSILPYGQFILDIREESDSLNSNPNHSTNININNGSINAKYLQGSLTVHFKDLVHKGGGPFSGEFIMSSGSAQVCGTGVFENLAPLNVTGTLDLASSTVSLRIKGKAYF